MGRKPRVDRSPEEKWQIVQEALKSGNVSETCRRHGISPSLLYRWRDEAEAGAKAALGGKAGEYRACLDIDAPHFAEKCRAPQCLTLLAQLSLSAHNFAHSAEDENTEHAQKSLKMLVDVTGIEPVTPCLQSRCSPS